MLLREFCARRNAGGAAAHRWIIRNGTACGVTGRGYQMSTLVSTSDEMAKPPAVPQPGKTVAVVASQQRAASKQRAGNSKQEKTNTEDAASRRQQEAAAAGAAAAENAPGLSSP